MRLKGVEICVLLAVVVVFQVPEATCWGGWKSIGREISKGLSQAGREVETAAAKVATEVSNAASQGREEVKNFAHSVKVAVRPEPEPDPDPEEVPVVLPTFVPREPVLLGCTPLVNPTLDVTCLKDGRVDCRQPMESGTVAKLTCKSQYKLPEPYPGYAEISCTAGYTWSRPLFTCVPDCGKRNSPTKMSGGTKVPQLEFPWAVGVYKPNTNGGFDRVCSGSLITADLVITAASCFWDTTLKAKIDHTNYKLLAGSYHKHWPTVDDPSIQKANINEVYLHERFAGRTRRLSYNIAVVRLAEPLVLTRSVNIVCVDWNPRQKEVEEGRLTAGDNGIVSSWGNTSANTSSTVNVPVKVPYIPALDCSDTIDDEVQDYLTPDKVCGGRNQDETVCPEDTGSGYVFPLDMVQGKRFYLRGIASAPFVEGDSCQTQNLAIFTFLSAHSKWVNKIVFGH